MSSLIRDVLEILLVATALVLAGRKLSRVRYWSLAVVVILAFAAAGIAVGWRARGESPLWVVVAATLLSGLGVAFAARGRALGRLAIPVHIAAASGLGLILYYAGVLVAVLLLFTYF
jgi:hypothetical protein